MKVFIVVTFKKSKPVAVFFSRDNAERFAAMESIYAVGEATVEDARRIFKEAAKLRTTATVRK
jgi:hypothetical protein